MSILSERLAAKFDEEHVCPQPEHYIDISPGKTETTIKVVIHEDPDRVTISRDRLKLLMEAEEMLSALEAGGVDNWEGYEFALATRNQP